MHTNIELSLKTKFYDLFLVEYFFKYAFTSNTLKMLNPHYKSRNKIFTYIWSKTRRRYDQMGTVFAEMSS